MSGHDKMFLSKFKMEEKRFWNFNKYYFSLEEIQWQTGPPILWKTFQGASDNLGKYPPKDMEILNAMKGSRVEVALGCRASAIIYQNTRVYGDYQLIIAIYAN